LRPQTWSKPKPLVGVGGKPILAHVLDRVLPLNPSKIVYVTGYLGDQIKEWALNAYDLPQAFVVQPEMKGQTDAILRCREVARDDALIIFPDSIFEADLSGLKNLDADGALFTIEFDDPSAFGIAVKEGDRVTRLVEKPKDPISKEVLMGMYYVRSMPALYAAIEEQMRRDIQLKGEYFIADAFQLMIDGGARFVTMPVTVWEDCGSIDGLLQTNRYLLDQRQATGSDSSAGRDSVLVQPSYVAATAALERAVVGPYAVIGERAVVRDAVVRDAIVEDDAIVENAVIEHSVVGRKAAVVGRAISVNVGDMSRLEL
jgi:glucose-1-phosphate thymidylyltransferase